MNTTLLLYLHQIFIFLLGHLHFFFHFFCTFMENFFKKHPIRGPFHASENGELVTDTSFKSVFHRVHHQSLRWHLHWSKEHVKERAAMRAMARGDWIIRHFPNAVRDIRAISDSSCGRKQLSQPGFWFGGALVLRPKRWEAEHCRESLFPPVDEAPICDTLRDVLLSFETMLVKNVDFSIQVERSVSNLVTFPGVHKVRITLWRLSCFDLAIRLYRVNKRYELVWYCV